MPPASPSAKKNTAGEKSAMMKNTFWFLLMMLFIIPQADAEVTAQARATLVDSTGKPVGNAAFFQGPAMVVIGLYLYNLPPGPHAVHLHAVGACRPDFLAAKGHINPNNVKHGILNGSGPDNGDLPNVMVGPDGTAHVEIHTPWVSINQGMAALLDQDGSTIIIHAKADDHITQPIGGAGARIACGVIVPN